MYLDALPIPSALSDSGRPLPRHSALSLEYFHRTDHRRRQRAQPIGLSQCTANCEKRPQRSPLSRLKMPVRTKGNAASFGNSLLRQITLKAKSANRIADFLYHSGYYIISHNLHFYDNQRRILYSIIIIMSIAPRKSELIGCTERFMQKTANCLHRRNAQIFSYMCLRFRATTNTALR